MIFTLTLNPSIDYTMEINDLIPGGMNRAVSNSLRPGGKGINVSIILDALGMPNTILGFIAGFTGDEIEKSLKQGGHNTDFIRLKSGLSRINVKLCSNVSTEVNANGPMILNEDMALLNARLDSLQSGDVLVMSGSLPNNLPDFTYSSILERIRDRGILTFVDTSGESLLSCLPCKPFLIKPNRQELEELFSTKIELHTDVVKYAARLQELGARNVLVSLDSEGALLLCEDGRTFYREAPTGVAVNTVGAGDSMLAGFIYGWQLTGDYEKAFRYGIASGSASAFSEGLASGEDILSLFRLLE